MVPWRPTGTNSMKILDKISHSLATSDLLDYFVRLPLTAYRINSFVKKERERNLKDHQNLTNYERKVYSQNGEDGIIEEIFRRLGSGAKFFVEFGVQDGCENNTRNLLENEGWSGVWIEADENFVEKARTRFATLPVHIAHRFLTRENINQVFQELEIPQELDLLVIDVDGNDYWLWQALQNYRPRVVVIEYNSSYPPGKNWVMPYNSNWIWDGTNHFGATLDSYYSLNKQKTYSLVGCDSRGINAFFVRDDLVGETFSYPQAGPTYHYNAPKYNKFYFGHPKSKFAAGRGVINFQSIEGLQAQLAEKERQLALLNSWAINKEKNVEQTVASLNAQLIAKEREIAALRAILNEAGNTKDS